MATVTIGERITVDPEVMAGRPCIRGMRITVALVLNLTANGMSEAEIMQQYPDLEPEDLRECLRYAARLADGRISYRSEGEYAVPR